MIENWELLYKEMMSAVEACWQLDIPESQQIKKVYKISTDYLHRLESQLKKYTFGNYEDEFLFHKNVRTKFTSYIEYLHLINQEHLFTLNQTKEFIEDYWIFETNRLNRFIERNIEFAEFYKRDCTEYNLQNFLSSWKFFGLKALRFQ